MSTLVTMPTKTICPPRCRRNDRGVLPLPTSDSHDKKHSVHRAASRHDTMRHNAPNAKANGLLSGLALRARSRLVLPKIVPLKIVLPKDLPNASHRRTAINNRVAASAMLLPNVHRAIPIVRNKHDPINLERNDRALNDQAPINRAPSGPVAMKHDAMNRAANARGAIALATNNLATNNLAANGRSPKRALNGLRNVLASATHRRRASAPRVIAQIAIAVPSHNRPKLLPQRPLKASPPSRSACPRLQQVLHSLRSPAWVSAPRCSRRSPKPATSIPRKSKPA